MTNVKLSVGFEKEIHSKYKDNSFSHEDIDDNLEILETTTSLCPVCHRLIKANIESHTDNYIWMTKSCPDHGNFEDKIWYDIDNYKRFQKYRITGRGITPSLEVINGCPYDCGPCKNHETFSMLIIFDVTNRCNLNCPICFANANASGTVYEPSILQIRKTLQHLTEYNPRAANIMFSGGEPTVRKDLPDIITMAKNEYGFTGVLLATNGLKIAESLDYAKTLKKVGVDMIYLQFDGFDDEIYQQFRGRKLLDLKMKALDNCREADLFVTFVVTTVGGVNDDQMGDIIKFAFDNIDIVKSVNFQPVSFSGRIEQDELISKRVTNGDLIRLIGEQTNGLIKSNDWSPIPAVAPLEKALNLIYGKKGLLTSTHPTCGIALYVFKSTDTKNNPEFVPLNYFVNYDQFMQSLEVINQSSKLSRIHRMITSIKVIRSLSRSINYDKSPSYMDMRLFTFFKRFIRGKSLVDPEEIKRKALFIGSMHFMDPYNFDLKRLQKCCVHYPAVDGRLIPFCAYNNLACYRKKIEAENSHDQRRE